MDSEPHVVGVADEPLLPTDLSTTDTTRTSLVLGPLLRHVTESSATVWVETDRRCVVSVTVDSREFSTATFCVHGHYYALVIAEHLPPGCVMPYTVSIDDVPCWPGAVGSASAMPAPVIRTELGDRRTVLFGSCRSAAPHEPPYSLELDNDKRGRGVDAFRAHGLRMLRDEPTTWPDLMLMLGDQIYADDPSPRAGREIGLRRLGRRRRHTAEDQVAPPGIAGGFDDYCSLYLEAWTPDIERWMLSVIPTAMIFDDHDMIDDWNISAGWVDEIRREPWWQEHIVAGLMTYWIYQHLGNQSPAQIRDEGILAELQSIPDGTELLRGWAMESERFTPVSGGYQFSHHRDVGDVRIVVVDCRNGRVLDPAERQIIDDDEWARISSAALEPAKPSTRHVVLASSLPILAPGGIHDLQHWNEAMCAGRWGTTVARISERVRRSIDLEDWAAFARSFTKFETLVGEVSDADGDRVAPDTVLLLSGDIHFAYTARARWRSGAVSRTTRITQIVCSPLRNALSTKERRAIRFSLSRTGRWLGRRLRATIRATPTALEWQLDDGPIFANNIGMLTFDGDRPPHLRIERAHPDEHGDPVLTIVVDHPV